MDVELEKAFLTISSEMARRFAILETKQDNTKETLQRIEETTKATNGRIKKLEMWRMFLLGAWAVLSLATPVAWYFIVHSLDNYSHEVDTRIGNAIQLNNNKYFEKP